MWTSLPSRIPMPTLRCIRWSRNDLRQGRCDRERTGPARVRCFRCDTTGRLPRTTLRQPEGRTEAGRFWRAWVNLTVDRARLQAIFTEAGHPDLVVPQSLDGAAVSVQIPRAVQVQYGTCPTPTTATNAIASNVTGSPAVSTQFSDCVRLREGSSPTVNIPSGLDVEHLAEIGLELRE